MSTAQNDKKEICCIRSTYFIGYSAVAEYRRNLRSLLTKINQQITLRFLLRLENTVILIKINDYTTVKLNVYVTVTVVKNLNIN